MGKTVVLMEWFENFTCPGGDCGLTCCCDDWKIALTDKEVTDYKNNKSEFSKRFIDAIDFDKKSFKYHNGKCAMLNDKGYCDIVLNLGEEYLSTTCATFPREERDFNFMGEMYTEIVCPLVSERLFDNKKMEFSFVEIEADDVEINPEEANYVFNMFSFRTALIEALQNDPGENIHGKVFLVANAYEYMKNILASRDVGKDDVDVYNEKYLTGAALANIYNSCEKFAEMKSEKADYWLSVFFDLYEAKAIEIIFRILRKNHKYIEDKILGWRENLSEYRKCFEGYRNYLKENYPYFEQNYFIYSLFINWIDLDKENFGNKLCGRFVELILFHLCGMAIYDKGEFDVKEFSVSIAAIDRAMTHSANVLYECGKSFSDIMRNEPICIMKSLV